MSNYGRGLWHIISQTREGRNILFPSFTFSFSLGGQVTSAQLEMGEGGCAQTSAALTLQGQLDLPKAGPPGSACLFLFFLSPGTQFPCGCQGRPSLHLPPFCCLPFPAPPWNGVQSVSPAKGPGWATGRRCYVCVCVCYRGQHTALSGNQRALSRGVRPGGQRKKIRGRVRQQQRPGGGRPHLLAECRGNGGRRGPSSPRQSKQDRWARAWRD